VQLTFHGVLSKIAQQLLKPQQESYASTTSEQILFLAKNNQWSAIEESKQILP